jgi:anthranilate synthase component 1
LRYQPAFDDIVRLSADYSLIPVYRQLVSDTLTPVSAFCKIQEGDWAFLFESVVGGERIGRYSFLGAAPRLRFQAFDRRVEIIDEKGSKQELTVDDPLCLLEQMLKEYRAPTLPGLPRFSGGLVGYAGYDTIRYAEKLPNAPSDDRRLPDLCFALYDRMIIFDQITKTIKVVGHVSTRGDLKQNYNRTCEQIEYLVERLQRGVADLQLTDIHPETTSPLPSVKSNFTKEQFESAVRKCIEYINAGDIFQVVISQRFQTETRARPFDIYRALRVLNPSPFMFYLKAGPLSLVGSSPEIMVRVEGDLATVRPLAGTRRRGKNLEEDEQLANELAEDPKERAEHIMLVDLARNDLGRVSQFGTVRYTDLLTVERYSHVMHLASTVTGKLLAGNTCFDALRSSLPAGTLSGAPKVRAMQIIDEIEPHRRGPYGGAVGYADFSGNMDTCIALRTMVLLGQTAYLQAGAGIVADSIPEMEYQETVNKSLGLLRALEMAESQL